MLPIHAVREAIIRALRQRGRLALAAPTGSGKTTQVPQFIVSDLSPPGRVVVLQPRRIAARMMAQRVAHEMGLPLGDGVGYQTRHESRIGAKDVIRFMTEGLLVRQLQSQPTLPGVAVVVLDEFHERNLAGDAALALLKRLQATHRPDLKLMVMSATLDVQAVAAYLDCPVVEADGRLHPVAIGYLAQAGPARAGQPAHRPIWDLAADALQGVLEREHEGDVLVFMPGVLEIRRAVEACQRRCAGGSGLQVLPLYSELPITQQDLVMSPSPRGVRRVIVATNVAETSLTIPGVRHVIDTGLARVNRYDARRGVNTLFVEPISQASADQRAGRAGRTAPGTCLRLWTAFEHKGRSAHTTPEIQRLDLAQAMLWLIAMGVDDVRRFDWFESPDPAAMDQALALLSRLGALDDTGRLTDLGRLMAKLPVHPRWARVLVEADQAGCLAQVIRWAAIASERDLTGRQDGARQQALAQGVSYRSDFEWLDDLLAQAVAARFDVGRCAALGIHAAVARQVDATIRQLNDACQDAGLGRRPGSPTPARKTRPDAGPEAIPGADPGGAACLLAGFDDHLAMRRGQGTLCAMIGQSRRACELSPQSVIDPPGLLLAMDLREVSVAGGVKTVLGLLSAIEPEWLEDRFPHRVVHEKVVAWNRVKQVVEEVERRRLDDLVYAEKARPTPDPDQAAALLAQKVLEGELRLNRWDDDVTQWIARTRSVALWFPERGLITYDADDLAVIHQEICQGCARYTQIADKPCLDFVRNALGWDDQQFVEKMAPARLPLPRGWRMPLTYADDGSPPAGRAKIQDLYDLTVTPSVAAGRVRVKLEILGPNHRPVQVTEDLAGFWQTLYPELRKELKRRYPRHEWR